MAKTFERTTFRTAREMDFFSERELITQTGHGVDEWPLVIVKELIDNALDACEQVKDGPAPVISIAADAGGITVTDNGSGIPDTTLAGAMDFSVRCSNREMYVAPDRGAQGNALMTLLSMPFVLDPDGGKLIVDTGGTCHEIVCRANQVSQCAEIDDRTSKGQVESGTLVRIEWSEETDDYGDVVWPFDDWTMKPLSVHTHPVRDNVLRMARGYAFFNPHLTIKVDWFDETILDAAATNTGWKKWLPRYQTSPHWYELRHLERLIGAYVTNGTTRTVSDFLSEFDGLKRPPKRKLVIAETDLARVKLSGLIVDGDFDHTRIERLLDAMKRHTRPVAASKLGLIGRDHIATRIEELGGDPEQFEYAKSLDVEDGMPSVLETAFCWLGDDALNERQIFAGANWSAAINNPFRVLGSSGDGLNGILREQYAGPGEPIAFLLHVAHPRVEYADRGKSSIVIGGGR